MSTTYKIKKLWEIEYPIGESPYGPDNIVTEHWEIAKYILDELVKSKSLEIPVSIAYLILDLNSMNPGWEIKLID